MAYSSQFNEIPDEAKQVPVKQKNESISEVEDRESIWNEATPAPSPPPPKKKEYGYVPAGGRWGQITQREGCCGREINQQKVYVQNLQRIELPEGSPSKKDAKKA